ncbi:MAG: molybdopterin biosynthesis protein, partial [Firmicutes bacterium]|nr:molybdopterin biosynthesis protein [Bacillota bacterium]
AQVREGIDDGSLVKGMEFSYDAVKVDAAIAETYKKEGIFFVKAWLNEGRLEVGDDIMYVLIGGDIRLHVVDALQFLVEKIKTECVIEKELKA